MKSIYRNLLRIAILAAFVFCAFNFSTVRETAAVSSSATMYIDAEGDGKITGTVGSAITPYRFTLTVKKGPAGTETPSFKYAHAAGENVTDWFQGTCVPEKNVFKSLPIGLTVKTVNAIEAGDKKTADGTQLRVLVVVTHADKTVEVFESGVITIGEKAE